MDYVDLNEICGDEPISLDRLLELVPQLQEKYGKEAVVKFDAGYNNVVVRVKPSYTHVAVPLWRIIYPQL